MLETLRFEALQSLLDVAPIVTVILAFQLLVLRQPPAQLRVILIGAVHLLIGLTLFRVGLAWSIMPLGSNLAEELVAHGGLPDPDTGVWRTNLWLYAFAALMGLTATLIEPTLIAVAERVRAVTGGGLDTWHFRIVVAAGVALGLALGTLRIVAGIPLIHVVLPLVMLIGLLALLAPRAIVPLALDSGPMATSVVTVPLIAAFGVAVAATVPGRDPMLDGFGLIVLALLAPVCCVLAFTVFQKWRMHWRGTGD